MSDLNTAIDLPAKRLADNRYAFFQNPFNFTWWSRGGEPGSPSGNLTLEGDHGHVKGTYIRACFDPSHQPPVHSETFHEAVSLDRATAILTKLFESPFFRSPSEADDAEMRDARKESWGFRNQQAKLDKTLIEPFPEALASLQAMCVETAEDIVKLHPR